MNPRRRTVVVAVVLCGLLAGLAGGLWIAGIVQADDQYAGQERAVPPLEGLTLKQHGLGRVWLDDGQQPVADEAGDRDGFEEAVVRSWSSPSQGGPRAMDYAEMEQTIYRYASVADAVEQYRASNPDQVLRESLELPGPAAPELRSSRIPPAADEVRYYCGPAQGPPGTPTERSCRSWYVWMRYGQYLVEVHVDAVNLAPDDPLFTTKPVIPESIHSVAWQVDSVFRHRT